MKIINNRVSVHVPMYSIHYNHVYSAIHHVMTFYNGVHYNICNS